MIKHPDYSKFTHEDWAQFIKQLEIPLDQLIEAAGLSDLMKDPTLLVYETNPFKNLIKEN